MAKPKLALVGGQTLLGRELRDAASQGFDVQAMDTADAEGKTLVRDQEGVDVMPPVDTKTIEAARIVILAGDLESTAKVRTMKFKDLIDLTGVLDIDPKARLRSPLSGDSPGKAAKIHVIAHPVATMLALFLKRLNAISPIARAVANVFHPASELGLAGITELQQQTVSLFSFKPIEKKVFDAQAAFNMLASLGLDAPVKLADVESRIERHLTVLLAGAAPMPSLRLSQAPAFHGISASVWVEFMGEASWTGLGGGAIDIHGDDLDPPNNVGMANQDGVSIGAIQLDRASSKAAWFWLAADNHRLAAQNAMLVAKEILDA